MCIRDRRLTSLHLEESGVPHLSVGTAEEAVRALEGSRSNPFDVMLLDVELPGVKGWELLAQLRESGEDIPVIFLTVLEDLQQRVKGLELGADDYIVKPAQREELVARLRAVHRRSQKRLLQLGDLTMNLDLRKVTRAGEPVDLSPREFELLLLLVQARGRPVSRGELLRRIWGLDFDPETNVLAVHMSKLRKKIEREGPPLIETVRGQGYCIHGAWLEN